MFKKKYFINGLIIFIVLQTFYYAFLMVSYQIDPFNKYLYSTGFHYTQDPRQNDEPFNLINALSAWDGQWYMRIADTGYTTKTEISSHGKQILLDQYAYAFFPLYPYLVSFINLFIQNTLLSAFILDNILLVALFFSVYYVVTKLYTEEIAMRTNFLLLFYPLSLFYRAYYAESLFLLLLIWFGYALVKRKWLLVGITLTAMYLTKANGLFLLIPLISVLISDFRKKKISFWKSAAVLLIPFIAYIYLFLVGKMKMDNGMVWITAHNFWGQKNSMLFTIQHNFLAIYNFFSLPDHEYLTSKTEIIAFFVGLFLLIKTKKILHPELWRMSFGLLIAPLFVKSFTSYARYEIVVFPLFIYLAMKLKGIWYNIAITISFLLLLWFSTIFINWGWIE